MLGGLKLLWTSIGGVEFKGKGIITDWGEEMERKGWVIETDPEKWKECDLVFYGSDSQLYKVPEPLGKKPTILYFWGWEPARLLDRGFQAIAQEQLKLMAQCTRILVPSLGTMDQVADFGLPSHVCLPGVNSKVLDWGYGLPVNKKSQVMFLSRLAVHKHLDALIQALSLIEPSPQLLAVGPGDKKPYEDLASGLKVPAMFMELEENKKVEVLRESAVLVHPSSYEGFGLPPLEALYCMTPVIAFDIPQMRWLLQEDAYYFSTIEGLAEAIIHVFQNPSEAQVKAVHGSDRIRKSLTLEHACDRLWIHIHQVIKEFLGGELRRHPERWKEIYDEEHKRNWAYGLEDVAGYNGPARFDPTWERHWRAQAFIEALKECHARDILDVGCGAVYPTIFARAGFKVHAVDISPEAIKQVKEVAQKWNVGHKVAAHVGDALDLKFDTDYFDAVIHGELWEHIPAVEKVISEGLRVLKPGGYLIATTPIGTHHHDPMHWRTFDDQSIQDLIGKFQVDGKAKCVKLEKIAEQGTDPSCYLVVLEKTR